MHRQAAARLFGLWIALILITGITASAEPIIEKGPYLQQVDTTSIIVCWVTNFEAPSAVEYGPTERFGQRTEEVLTDRERREQVWTAGGERELVAFHQVQLTGLQPDTRYCYRVKTGGAQSQISTFYTAVRPGTPFSFAVYGDAQAPRPGHRVVVERMLALTPEPRFILNTGDLLSDGQRWPDWQGFFDYEGPLLAKVPFFTSLGNHVHDAENYFALFNLPGTERWYSFTYGDVHVVILDSNPPHRANPAQRQWLMQDLEQHYNSPYAFVVYHHPIYTCTNTLGRRVGAVDLAEEWAPIFEAYEVTAVFNGHDHNYQHNLVNGVTYVVTGGGGVSIYPVRPRSFTVKTAPVFHVVQVEIGPAAATFTAIKADDGKVIETWSVPRRDTTALQYSE